MTEKKHTLHGIARAIWVYGIVFAAMFLLYSFTNLGIAVLDADYSNIGGPLIFGAYGVAHLVINNAFKTAREWGRLGLIGLYGLWTLLCLISLITTSDPLTLATAAVIGPLSLALTALLLRGGAGRPVGVQ